jgi:hypothetical protein
MSIEFKGLYKSDIETKRTKAESTSELVEDMKTHMVEDPAVIDWLSKMDFSLVEKIFAEDYVKSGGEAKDVHVVDKANFIVTNNQRYLHLGTDHFSVMCYLPEYNAIVVNAEELHNAKIPAGVNRKVLFLGQLFHEEGHSAQSHFFEETEEGTVRAQQGLAAMEVKEERETVHKHWFFNEAINDMQARSNTLKYISRNGENFSKKDLEWLSDIYAYPQPNASYFAALHILNEICIKLSAQLGIPKDIVTNSWIHAGYNGLVLTDKETKKELNLDSYFKKGFSNDLAQLQMSGDPFKIFDFIDKYELHINQAKFDEIMKKMRTVY